MARQAPTPFLEDWLRSIIGNSSNQGLAANSSAQGIIQAWAELRACLQQNVFNSSHFQSLKSLVDSQASLYVADPQAKLLVGILSSPNISLPNNAYPLFMRLLYIWVRKSSKPSLSLIESALGIITQLFGDQFDSKKSTLLFAEGVLLVGALSSVASVSTNTKALCLQLLSRMLEEQYQLIGSVGRSISHVLAGIGYALSSSGEAHLIRLLNFMLGSLTQLEVSHDISLALGILHVIEWVVFGFLNSGSLEKIRIFTNEVMEYPKKSCVLFAVLMATAGALRASNRLVKLSEKQNIVSGLKVVAETQMEVIAADLSSRSNEITEDAEVSFLFHCLSLAAARSGVNSTRGPLLVGLTFALLLEVFPLRKFYAKILESPRGNLEGLMRHSEMKEHQDTIIFKEAGATTGVFCNLYASASESDKCKVEGLVWDFCHDIYVGHRQVALLLQGSSDQFLIDLEKIAESAFLMVVVFALAVTKHRLTSDFPREIQMDVSVKILASFSCMEYFRRIRLPEYMEAIRSVAASVQDTESACVSFVETMPSYCEFTDPQVFPCRMNRKYVWSRDEVQTARILFYLRVIPTCVSRLPSDVFRRVIAATMFLYMGHPNVKVARASHSVFSSFVASEKESDQDERVLLKEQLVFYYMKRSLEDYPGITPFDGLASGVSALVRNLPAGSPSVYYCIHSLSEKANGMCRELMAIEDSELWKNWQGDSEPYKKISELLLGLISLVDIQVLPELMKLLARQIVQLPKDGQNMLLNELYDIVADSDDVIRKPTLVSWLQSLSFLCSRSSDTDKPFKEHRDGNSAPRTVNSLSLQNVAARL